MSNDHDNCSFGHIFEVHDEDGTGHSPGHEIRDRVKKGEITDLEDIKKEKGTDDLEGIMGNKFKHVKISAGSQGTPYLFVLAGADKFSEDWDWGLAKTDEKIYVTPQSQVHQEWTQRKQQAEQNIKQTMQGLEQLKKQKHMLEHDIRKLRSRAESFDTGDETQLKADFIELVDNSGGGQQGAAQGSLDFLRNNNIYPSIVADFNEMNSVEDLEEGGKLSELPENEKAVLKKKYTMYEKWKDLFGSEIQRKLKDLKGELQRVERNIGETEQWLEPYARDLTMINQKSVDELAGEMNLNFSFQGYATMFRQIEFIAYQPYEKEEGGTLVESDAENATHYKIVYMKGKHATIAGGENPNSPNEGPTSGIILWYPGVVCKHVFENIFKKKIEKHQDRFKELMDDYTGEVETKEGEKFKSARKEQNLAVRDLREKINEKVEDDVPVEFSSVIRRVEDGFDSPDVIAEKYSNEHLEAVQEILGKSFSEEKTTEKPLTNLEQSIREFTGQYDEYYLSKEGKNDAMYNLKNDIKFTYYYDLKVTLGLWTMK